MIKIKNKEKDNRNLNNQKAIEIANDIRKQTIAEFFKNPYIPIFEKVALTTFNYLRFTYAIYLKTAAFLISASRR